MMYHFPPHPPDCGAGGCLNHYHYSNGIPYNQKHACISISKENNDSFFFEDELDTTDYFTNSDWYQTDYDSDTNCSDYNHFTFEKIDECLAPRSNGGMACQGAQNSSIAECVSSDSSPPPFFLQQQQLNLFTKSIKEAVSCPQNNSGVYYNTTHNDDNINCDFNHTTISEAPPLGRPETTSGKQPEEAPAYICTKRTSHQPLSTFKSLDQQMDVEQFKLNLKRVLWDPIKVNKRLIIFIHSLLMNLFPADFAPLTRQQKRNQQLIFEVIAKKQMLIFKAIEDSEIMAQIFRFSNEEKCKQKEKRLHI